MKDWEKGARLGLLRLTENGGLGGLFGVSDLNATCLGTVQVNCDIQAIGRLGRKEWLENKPSSKVMGLDAGRILPVIRDFQREKSVLC